MDCFRSGGWYCNITPVASTVYHPLLEGGGATGCGINTKVKLRNISEKYHFLIDQWHCIYSLEICIKYNMVDYHTREKISPETKSRVIFFSQSVVIYHNTFN
jgi:hypothetical protein